MKKPDKENLLKKLKNYIENNQLVIKNNSYSFSGGITVEKNTKKEKQFDSYLEDFLFDLKIGKISGQKYVYDFTRDLVKNPVTQDLGVRFILSKAPSVSSYDYSEYIKESITVLRHYPEAYFDFISQTKFLETNFMELDKYFKNLKTEEHKEAIVEKCFGLKTFTSLKSQTYLYNLVQKELNNPEKYTEFFPTIKPVSVEEDIFGEVNKTQLVTVQIDVNKLNSRYMEECYGKEIVSKVNKVMESINKNTSLTSLGISKVLCENDENKDNIFLHFIGNNIEELKIKFFINALFKKPLEDKTYSQSFSEIILKNIVDSLKETSNNYLHSTLSDSDKLVKKAKI